MKKYQVKDYQPGFEAGQVRIGIQAARHWVWPYAYDLPSLLRIHAAPDFDPETRLYCFLADEMVGYVVSTLAPPDEDGQATANLDFPRTLPGHEAAAELLLEAAIARLRQKGIVRLLGRVTTMCPDEVRLAERAGFSIYEWGYKVYYSYQMSQGRLDMSDMAAEEIDPQADLESCAALAARWYHRPPEWCRAHLEEWHAAGVILTHAGLRREGSWIAACLAAPNEIRSSTAAIYYVYAPDERSLQPLLYRVVDRCIAAGVGNIIADLVHEHRQYEALYQALGFHKAAEWARCEKRLS